MPTPQRHVLLVEDNREWAESLRAAVQLDGPAVTLAASGPAALGHLAHQAPPDAILLDLLLPGMDGWEVYGQLRRTPALRDVPVVVMTGARALPEALLGGVAGFLHKPARVEPFLTHVRAQLGTVLGSRTPTPLALEVPEASALAIAALAAPTRHAVRAHLARAAELAADELPLASAWLRALPGPRPELLLSVGGVHAVLGLDAAARRLTVHEVLAAQAG